MELIDKEKVVVEIKRLRQKATELYGYSQFNSAYNNVLESLDNFETKEVDLEKELENTLGGWETTASTEGGEE